MRNPKLIKVIGRSVSVRHNGLNQTVERLNGTLRDREKVMRGMDHASKRQTS